MQIPIDIGYYESSSDGLISSNCVNLYPFNPEVEGAISGGALYRTAGIALDQTIGSSNCRGFFQIEKTDTMFAVYGTTLYKKTSETSDFTSVGTISGTGRVSFASNGTTMCIIAPGETGYFWSIASGLVEIVDAIFVDMKTDDGGVTSVALKDNRFVYTTDEQFYLGSTATTNNGKDFDALDFEDAEVNSDPIVRAFVMKNELLMFGTKTIEYYQSSSDSFPLSRILGATIDKGLAARFSLIAFDNSLMFIGQGFNEKPAVYRMQAGGVTKLSTEAIDDKLGNLTVTELEAVTAWSYSQNGHAFAGFKLPDTTLVFDAVASQLKGRSMWHERQSADTTWVVEDIITQYGKVWCGDSIGTNFGLISRDIYTEYGAKIKRTFTGPYIENDGNPFSLTSVELKCKAGTSLLKGGALSTNATIEMLVSTDGANTFRSVGSREIGLLGEFSKRQIWRRLGRVRYSAIFRFIVEEAISVDLYRLDVGTL